MGFLAKILFCIFLRKIIGGMFDSRVTQRPSNFLYSKDEGTSFGNIRDLDQASLMDILRRALGNQNNFEGSGEADSLNTFDINSDKKKTLHTCDTCDDCDSDFVTRVTSSGCVMCHVTVVRDTCLDTQYKVTKNAVPHFLSTVLLNHLYSDAFR